MEVSTQLIEGANLAACLAEEDDEEEEEEEDNGEEAAVTEEGSARSEEEGGAAQAAKAREAAKCKKKGGFMKDAGFAGKLLGRLLTDDTPTHARKSGRGGDSDADDDALEVDPQGSHGQGGRGGAGGGGRQSKKSIGKKNSKQVGAPAI